MNKFLGLQVIISLCLLSTKVYSQCDTTDIVVNKVIMPNVFTPDIDGYNDGFSIYADCIKSIEKKIYNKWGQLLYKSNFVNDQWNGRTTTGTEVPEGTYFYVFDVVYSFNNIESQKTYKGSLTLMR